MQPGEIDLHALNLRSGQGESVLLTLRPSAPVIGGVEYPLAGGELEARIEISHTTSGHALKLSTEARITGPCARCLGEAELALPILAREVDQPGTGDEELASPYVDEGILDATAWVHDAIRLELPEKVLCRPDCAGICEVCGISLNDLEPGSHSHEPPPDPRFAKLRELLDD